MTTIGKLRGMMERATPGPWYLRQMKRHAALCGGDHGYLNAGQNHQRGMANAELIIAAVNALPALLEAAQRAKEYRDLGTDKREVPPGVWAAAANNLDNALQRLEAGRG